MSKGGIQKSNFVFSKDRISKYVAHKTRTPFVKSVCGFEILVIPDLKAMNRALNNHVSKHGKLPSKRLTDFLTEQILIVTSKIKPV